MCESDFDDDLECLRIHSGGRSYSDCSDSDSEDSDIDEEYNILRPSPIPPDIIRQRSIYRPPSPNNNDKVTALHQSVKKKKRRGDSCGHVREKGFIRNHKNGRQVKCAEKSAFLIIKSAQDLVDMILNDILCYSNKLSIAYIEALDKFRINVDCFGDGYGTTNFPVLLSNFYAFIVSEFLLVVKELRKVKRSNNILYMKSLEFIGKIGNNDEISKKIHLRKCISFEDLTNILDIDSSITIQMTNSEILNDLDNISHQILEITEINRYRSQREIMNNPECGLTSTQNEDHYFQESKNTIGKTIYIEDVSSNSNHSSSCDIVTSSESMVQESIMEDVENLNVNVVGIQVLRTQKLEKQTSLIKCETIKPDLKHSSNSLERKIRKRRKKKKMIRGTNDEYMKFERQDKQNKSLDMVNTEIHHYNYITQTDEQNVIESRICNIYIAENLDTVLLEKPMDGENSSFNRQRLEDLVQWYIKQVREFNRQNLSYDMMNTKKYFLVSVNLPKKKEYLRQNNRKLYINIVIGGISIVSALAVLRRIHLK